MCGDPPSTIAPTGSPITAAVATPTPTPTPTPRPTPSPTPRPTPTPSPTPSPTPRPTPRPTLPPTPVPTPSPTPTEGPELHTAPDLEALLPSVVGGVPLHKTSPDISAQLAADPRARNGLLLLRLLGKSADDVRFAQAVDPADPSHLSIAAIQIQGLDARVFGRAVLGVLLNAVPDAQTSDITLAGKPVIKAVSPSGGPSGYIYETGDIVFGIETTDEALAVEVLNQLP